MVKAAPPQTKQINNKQIKASHRHMGEGYLKENNITPDGNFGNSPQYTELVRGHLNFRWPKLLFCRILKRLPFSWVLSKEKSPISSFCHYVNSLRLLFYIPLSILKAEGLYPLLSPCLSWEGTSSYASR